MVGDEGVCWKIHLHFNYKQVTRSGNYEHGCVNMIGSRARPSACDIYDTIEYNIHRIDTENRRDRIDIYLKAGLDENRRISMRTCDQAVYTETQGDCNISALFTITTTIRR